VKACTLCHEEENLSWEETHDRHDNRMSCTTCHTDTPTGLVEPQSTLCDNCHRGRSENDTQKLHEKHVEKDVACAGCHTF
jgi:hypothetical protein